MDSQFRFGRVLPSGAVMPDGSCFAEYYELESRVEPITLGHGGQARHTTTVYLWTDPDRRANIVTASLRWRCAGLQCNEGTCDEHGNWELEHQTPNNWQETSWGERWGSRHTEFVTYLARRTQDQVGMVELVARATRDGDSGVHTVHIDLP